MSAVPYRATFVRLLGFLRPYRVGLAVSIALAVGSQAAQIALVWLTGRNIIDHEEVAPKVTRRVGRGGVVRIETPGGGGWGSSPRYD